jgi:tape measure domain-containing protein
MAAMYEGSSGGNILETLSVQIQALTGKFNDHVRTSVNTAKRDLAEVEKPVTPQINAQAITGAVGNILGKFSQLGFAIFGVQQTFNALVSSAQGLIGFNAQLEKSEMGWKTMLGSAEAAKGMLLELQEFAAKTPFNFPEVEAGARRLLAMGFAAKDVLPVMKDISNVTAGMSLGNEGIRRITVALGQMNSKGRAAGEEIMQLTEAGVSASEILEIMAKNTGKTVAQLQKLKEEGKLSADEFIKAFRQWSQEKFGDAIANQAATWEGAISTIQDSLQIIKGVAMKPLFERFSQLAQAIANFVQTDEFMEWGTKVAATMDVVLSGIDSLASGFITGLSAILDSVNYIGEQIYIALTWLDPFEPHSPPLVEQVRRGTAQILKDYQGLTAITEPITKVGQVIEAFGEASARVLERSAQKAEEARLKALSAFGGDVVKAYNDAKAAVESFTPVMDALSASIEEQSDKLVAMKSALAGAERAIKDKERSIRAAEKGMKPYEEAVDRARKNLEALQRALDDAKRKLQGFMSAPIEGTKEYAEKQKDLAQQVAETELALLRLKKQPIDETDAVAVEERANAVAELEAQLEKLNLEADELRLEEKVKFDPLRRQIDDLTDTTKELSFAEIVAGIKSTQLEIANLEARMPSAEENLLSAERALASYREGIEREREALEGLRETLQGMQESYATEEKKLSDLKQQYADVSAQAALWQKVLDEIASKAESITKADEAAAKKAATAAGAAKPEIDKKDTSFLADAIEKQKKLAEMFEEMKTQAGEAIKPVTDFLGGIAKGFTDIGLAFNALPKYGLSGMISQLLYGQTQESEVDRMMAEQEMLAGKAPKKRGSAIPKFLDPYELEAQIRQDFEIFKANASAYLTEGFSAIRERIRESIAGWGPTIARDLRLFWYDVEVATSPENLRRVRENIADALSAQPRMTDAKSPIQEYYDKQVEGVKTLDWKVLGVEWGTNIGRTLRYWAVNYPQWKADIHASLGEIFLGIWEVLKAIARGEGAKQKAQEEAAVDFWKFFFLALADSTGLTAAWNDFATWVDEVIAKKAEELSTDIAAKIFGLDPEGVRAQRETNQKAFDEFWRQIGEFLSPGYFVPAFQKLMKGFGESMTAWGKQAGRDVTRVATDIYDGLRVGFEVGLPKFFEEMKAWVDSIIIRPVKEMLGIASPSQVFFDLAVMTIEGLWNGFVAKAKATYTTIADWVTANVIDPVLTILGLKSGEDNSANDVGTARGKSKGLFEVGVEGVTALIDGLVSKARELWEKAFEIGKSIVQGIRDGIRSMKIPIPRLDIGQVWSDIIGRYVPTFGIGFDERSLADIIPALAKGVRDFVGGLAIVGEAGPELVRLPRGADVYSNSETQRIFGEGSFGFGPDAFARALAEVLKRNPSITINPTYYEPKDRTLLDDVRLLRALRANL